MDTVRLQETNPYSVPRLGCAQDEANSLSTIPIWTVSTDTFFQETAINLDARKYFVTMGLRTMKWDEWIGKQTLLSNATDFPIRQLI